MKLYFQNYKTLQQKIVDFAIGFVGWFVVNGLLSFIVIWLGGGYPDGLRFFILWLFALPLTYVINIVAIVLLGSTYYWIAIGVSIAFIVNLLTTLVLGHNLFLTIYFGTIPYPLYYVSSLPTPTPTATATPTPIGVSLGNGKGQIAFVTNVNGKNNQIYIMNGNSRNITRLMTPFDDISSPAWSPDGQKIAFFVYPKWEIYVINADGSNLVRLTGGSHPTWSPDGKQISFNSGQGSSQIFVINVDGSNLKPLTDGQYIDFSPSWSPNGKEIAFYSHREGTTHIYVMNADGSGLRKLTNDSSDDYSPHWSPDGTRIVFVRDQGHNEQAEIYVMNADGGGVIRLTNNRVYDNYPSWSPDGKQIIFLSSRDNPYSDFYMMNADGSNVVRLTNTTTNKLQVEWAPDPFTAPRSSGTSTPSPSRTLTPISTIKP